MANVLGFIEQELGSEEQPWLAAVEHGVDQLPVEWNGRLKTTAGSCYWRYGRPVRIELNPLLREEGPEAVRETFLHELAHAVAMAKWKDTTHGVRFKAACAMVGVPGAARCHSYAALHAKRAPRRLKLVAACVDGCGAEYHGRRYKSPWKGGHAATYLCRHCGSELEVDPRELAHFDDF